MTNAASAAQRLLARDGRVATVRAEMAARGLDLLVAYGSGRHLFLGGNPCWWLSGLRQLGRHAAVVVPLEGEPVLVTTPAWDGPRAARRSWLDDVVATDDLPGELRAIVRARGWRAVTAGLAGHGVAPAGLPDALAAAFERLPVAADDALATVSRVPDPWAMALIERAVEIAEAGYRRLCDVARPGLREHELAAEVGEAIRALGADDNFQLLSASQHNRAVRPPGERELAEGDVILGEISPSVEGQFAQICRSAAVGEPSEVHRASFATLLEALAAGMRTASAGTPVREVTAEMNAVLAERGYGDFNRPPYMRTRGHTMGLGAMAPIDVSERSDAVLEEGMSFVLHPNQYFPECGYLLCGDQVVIETDGARSLASRGPRLDVVGGAVRA